jgi:hypothetical protein
MGFRRKGIVVLREILRREMEKFTGGWRKL